MIPNSSQGKANPDNKYPAAQSNPELTAEIIGRKSIANLGLQLRWSSPSVRHTETYYSTLNIWREADLLPPSLSQALMGQKAGAHLHLSLAGGAITPVYREDLVYRFQMENFAAGHQVPRLGRFYPRGLLTGFTGDPIPFRCTAVDDLAFTADFNHPLAGKSLEVEVVVLEVQKKRSERGGQCVDWLELLTSGPGIQDRWQGLATDFFADDAFRRKDEQDDARFYEQPRLVSHIDKRAIETIKMVYGRLLKPDLQVLDLMSSGQSHLPDALPVKSLIGLGLNEAELRHNPRLTDYLVHDLNQEPQLPFTDRYFEAVICNLSVEYLIRPFEVFHEVARVLKPGGLFVQTFSQRWFPPKVIQIWPELHEFERQGLVLEYFLRSGAFTKLETFSARGWPRPTDDRYYSQTKFSDPVFAVWGQATG
ncbi:MAG: methyltransferase domain-containing protein [Desulfobacca sp.]|nr:methyltransferase domain-containing protein [Desulfobacca sp.]